ncbi:hypothetical protein [Sporocytophaga myxococcoides]|uniref:hypothetical protein n=1 Tax=Sporocytophaga myxococcoides TaxID=153721 RepID=UPI00056D0B65|nr:hypothetical protein [Sporocytophaga myxococcoides]
MDFDLGQCYSIALSKGGYGGFFISELREEFNGHLNLGITVLDFSIHEVPSIIDFMNSNCIILYHDNFDQGGLLTYNIWPDNFLKCENIRYIGNLKLNSKELENVICTPISSIDPCIHLDRIMYEVLKSIEILKWNGEKVELKPIKKIIKNNHAFDWP